MKYLMTLVALVAGVTAGAQGTTIYEYPWNPDWDNDNLVGTSDLTGFLSAFGGDFGYPPQPCDYDGTPLEDLVFGILDGSIVVDSMFIEYELEDVSTYYVPGCPDPITDTLIFSNSAMLYNVYSEWDQFAISAADSYGHSFQFKLDFTGASGTYVWTLRSWALYHLEFLQDGFFGDYNSATEPRLIPFLEGWWFNEDGIHLDTGWNQSDWPYYANYLHILPYWHYAE